MTRATELRDKFHADLAAGVATMDAACAWVRAAFDEQCRVEMLKQLEARLPQFEARRVIQNDAAKELAR